MLECQSAPCQRSRAATSWAARAQFAPNSGKDRSEEWRQPRAPTGHRGPRETLLAFLAFGKPQLPSPSQEAASSRVARPAPFSGFESRFPH